MMASPHMMRLFLIAALLAALRPTSSSWSSSGTSPEPVLTFCSGQPLDSNSSSSAVTSGGEFASFLDAVCAGAYGVAHMSHNMSWYAAGTNRTMYGVAQCRPDVPVSDYAACLAAASSRLVVIGRTACAASAVWHDACSTATPTAAPACSARTSTRRPCSTRPARRCHTGAARRR
ncbi:hypothetical protein GQ55_7G119400 [Panicum hallii var. hallii]|uniref:Gnk2-homologous domain-containing protein n=1 Tax=Panicum hallii var. hallii TaxID=1504633 RepID=A0A2T7CU77_9POAL|nr:hypothetical protein GQ55_7G119400 [Panicum hallii var. hallii]